MPQSAIIDTNMNSTPIEDWIRLPKPGTRLYGLSRTTWNELIDNGSVKGITVKMKDEAKRGIRLIYKPSVDAYFEGLALCQIGARFK